MEASPLGADIREDHIKDWGGIQTTPFTVGQLADSLAAIPRYLIIEELIVDDKHTPLGEGPWGWLLTTAGIVRPA